MNPIIPFTDWLENCLQNMDMETPEQIVTLIYRIWQARNLLIFQDKEVPGWLVLQQAYENAQELRKASSPKQESSRTQATRRCGNNNYWKLSTKGTLKLNVDAHPFDDGRWTLGLVLRSEEGKCVGAATRIASGLESSSDGEALGLEAALEFSSLWPESHIVIEMDASVIVEAVKHQRYPRNYWGKVTRRCGEKINRNPKLSISWIRRTGNQAAHTLANWARFEPNKTWLNETPLCITEIIQKDISMCNCSV
jgi:ribonuclease HI